MCESKQHENSNLSQVTGLQNCISLIKSSSSCLQDYINTAQQRLVHNQGYTETEDEGHCLSSPPVQTGQDMDLNAEKFDVGLSVRHAAINLKSRAEKQTCPNNPTPFDIKKSKFEPVISSLKNIGAHVNPIPESLVNHNSESVASAQLQARTIQELSFNPPSILNSKGELCTHVGSECNSILPPSTMHLMSLPRLQPCETEAIVRLDSKSSPARPQSCPEDASLAHSHPADAALLLPPSPQCCTSASLQQRLETVEASLAANKDRITTLLNIIHDLETCHSPSSG